MTRAEQQTQFPIFIRLNHRMTLTAPVAHAIAFEPACQTILAGRPGVLFYHTTAAGVCVPQAAAVEPWIVATIHADRLCWRSYARATEHGEAFQIAADGRSGLALLQSLWDELATAQPTAAQPCLPVWFHYEFGEWLEPAVLRGPAATPANSATASTPSAPLGGVLIPRATLTAAGLDATSIERGRRLWRRFEAFVQPREPHPIATAPDTRQPATPTPTPTLAAAHAAADSSARDRYLAAVERVQNYIAAGDVYQVNVTRRETVAATQPAGRWFAAALQRHPAARASFWSCVDSGSAETATHRHFLSFTPERLLQIDPTPPSGWTLLSSPIKGTRARPADADPARLQALADELMHDPKELAELNMIIDMTRNDLGRIADLGSVAVLTPGRIDPLPYVLHRVADIRARARRPVPLADLLRALFPGASITGAPKIRAMQIIRELESTPRGIYCGVLGWLGAGHTADWSLAIRTLEADTLSPDPAGPWQGRFGVGAGIVADSTPAGEWLETVAKSRGILP